MTPLVSVGAATRLLFIGDSITSWGRESDPEQVGHGYVRMIRDFLAARHPASAPTVINRGVGSDDIQCLQTRWQRDVLELAPDVVSVLIGTNDVAHRLLLDETWRTLQIFEDGYRDILERTRRALPNTTIVLCEPPALDFPDNPQSNAELAPHVEAVQRVAATTDVACVVELYRAFAYARAACPDIAWMQDLAHPSTSGHALIAETWLAATGLRHA